MDKPKYSSKTKSVWQGFWDEQILMRRDFSFTTSLSLDETVMRIRGLTHKQNAFMNYSRLDADAYLDESLDEYQFHLELFWQRGNEPYKTLEAKGEILDENGKISVEGSINQVQHIGLIRLGRVLVITISPIVFLILSFFLDFSHPDNPPVICVTPIFLLLAVYMWNEITTERKNITKIIRSLKETLK